MHRNTRDTLRQYYAQGLLTLPPPQRQVQDEVFDYQEQAERDCYEAIKDYIDERYDQLEQEKAGKGFVMTVYRRRAASSPLALRLSLNRRLEKLERVIRRQYLDPWLSPDEEQIDARDLSDADIDERIDPALPSDPKAAEAEKRQIESLLARLDALGATDSKLAQFWSVLEDVTADGRSVLVFTEYTDTMKYLRDQLRPTYGATLGCYSGAGGRVWDGKTWASVSKAEITERLTSGDLKILVCTDAASEGLNLQAASALVNYDLPWNPSKVEQRIGRIDRIGQQQPVLPIRNLFLDNSVDVRVYEVLRERCGLFTHFVGRMQPVLALARDALRRNLRWHQTDAFLEALNKAVEQVQADEAVASTFVQSDAKVLPVVSPPVTRQDIETALTWLEDMGGRVKAKRAKRQGQRAWRLHGLRGLGRVVVTTDQETLERDPTALPMTLGAEVLEQLVERLPLPSHVPLVLKAHASGPYRCSEARWVHPDSVVTIESARQLVELVEAWDGKQPPPDLRLQAQDEARAAARQRVEAMKQVAQAKEEASLRRQLEAARRRLMREVGRTLRCLGDGDLNELLRKQVQRESRPSGRYHRALKLLGGYPTWHSEDVADVEAFARRASQKERKARVAGSEVDAAINDPRWKAREALKE